MGITDWRKLIDWRKLFDWRSWRTRLNLWAAMSPLERKLFVRIFLGGMLLMAYNVARTIRGGTAHVAEIPALVPATASAIVN